MLSFEMKFAGVYGEKNLLVGFGTFVLGDLLGDDGIHVFSFLMLGNSVPPQGILAGGRNKLFINQFSLNVLSSSRSP